MSFDFKMIQFRTGVTEYQLKLWSEKGGSCSRNQFGASIRYSFRDIVTLRIVAMYPGEASL